MSFAKNISKKQEFQLFITIYCDIVLMENLKINKYKQILSKVGGRLIGVKFHKTLIIFFEINCSLK